MPIDEEQLQGIIISSKVIVDTALNKAEAKARQMQEAEQLFRMVPTGSEPLNLFDPALHKTPADTIRQMMQFPKLAHYVTVILDDTSDIETLLLDKVARTFREHPQSKPSTLIAMWYGTPEGGVVAGDCE